MSLSTLPDWPSGDLKVGLIGITGVVILDLTEVMHMLILIPPDLPSTKSGNQGTATVDEFLYGGE